MSKKIIVLGAGGHAKVVADIILSQGDTLLGFLDDNVTASVLGYPVLGEFNKILKYQDNCAFIIGIGDNNIRRQIAEKYILNWHTAIHPSAVIARDVVIGEGTVVMAGAVVNPSTVIGVHCIINTNAVVEHDNRITDYVHVSPNATLCGTVGVGELTHIGAGAVVKNNITICENCIIGAGSAVVKDINEAGTYVGVPAKELHP